MHILYVDASGSVANPHDKHFILAGVSVFERAIYHEIRNIDEAVADFGIGPADEIELHGNPMHSGRTPPWKGIPRRDREKMLRSLYDRIAQTGPSVNAFGICVEKDAISPRDPVEYAFEEICNRFNLYLARLYRRRNEQQRGLVVMDESSYEDVLQRLAREFRVNGTRWGNLRNMAEVPLFVNSEASRLVQIADLTAYALWRRYEHQDARFFDPIIRKFDNEGGTIHGLVHYRDTADACYCPACMSRHSGL